MHAGHRKSASVAKAEIRKFAEHWKQLNPENAGFIPYDCLGLLEGFAGKPLQDEIRAFIGRRRRMNAEQIVRRIVTAFII